MKALLSLTVVVGLLISSTSNAVCLKQFAKQQNRYAASMEKTNFQPGVANKSTNTQAYNSSAKPGAARK